MFHKNILRIALAVTREINRPAKSGGRLSNCCWDSGGSCKDIIYLDVIGKYKECNPQIQKAHNKGGLREMLKCGILRICATYMYVRPWWVYFKACKCLILTSEITDRMGRISWTDASWLKTNEASSWYRFWLLFGLTPPSPFRITTKTLIVTYFNRIIIQLFQLSVGQLSGYMEKNKLHGTLPYNMLELQCIYLSKSSLIVCSNKPSSF